MAKTATKHWHPPSWLALLLVISGIALFLFLALWQLHRATEKEQLLNAFDGAGLQPTTPLEQARRDVKGIRYPHVYVQGRYAPDHTYILDNQIRHGRTGIMIFNIFEPADGTMRLLVNRGFLVRDAAGNLPVIPLPPPDTHLLTGLYAAPPGIGMRLGGNALPQQKSMPKLTIYIDINEISQDCVCRLDERILLLDAALASGFVREWKPQITPPDRHRAYAFQWFAFALAAGVIFIVLHWRRNK